MKPRVQVGLNRLYAPSGVGACADLAVPMAPLGLGYCDATLACRSQTVGTEVIYTLEGSGRCTSGGQTVERTVLVRARQ